MKNLNSKKKFILFLDFDGVLCTPRQAYANADLGLLGCLDPVAMRFLDRICYEHPVKVVISSTWRIGNDSLYFHGLFKAAGCYKLASSIHKDWATPRLSGFRGLEIMDWLERNVDTVHDYLIIDDESDMLDNQMSRFVKTSMNDGMLTEHYIKIESTIRAFFKKSVEITLEDFINPLPNGEQK